ncbi:MAG: hypothetical protein RL141_42 [Candidatus Parcubacteria bacterium]|jgi:glycosyltransferase involved in cell wall biosynthesis
MRYSVVIPALNEARTILHAVQEVRGVLDAMGEAYELIVVDDGSTDGTSQNVPSGVRVLRHAENQGKGRAVRTGVLAAQGEWVVVIDADLSTHPSHLRGMQQAFAVADVVMGSRRIPGSIIECPQMVVRDYAGRFFNQMVKHLLRLPYTDTQCGFKAFRREACQPLFESLFTQRWVFDAEVLVRARQAGLRIAEIPVVWRNGNETRVHWKDAWGIACELWRVRQQLVIATARPFSHTSY